jgi:hypothetical protein
VPGGLDAIARQRLRTQRLTGPGFAAPADVVKWFGAVQAQDYPGALWALGLRTTGVSEAGVEQAVANRSIVRTWPVRGTLHFVAAADVHWMIQHFASRTAERTARRFVQFGFDRRTFVRTAATIVKALEGGHQLTRPTLYARLERAGIATGGSRGLHLMWKMAHDGLICFGVRDGKQHTFTLLDEWVPKATAIDRDEALGEMARRYFTSHGPATSADFAWWSGLTATEARRAMEIAGRDLRRASVDGMWHWLSASATAGGTRSPRAVLLPCYDEYTVAYRDRSAALDPRHAVRARNGIFRPTILLDGRIVGTWTRRLTGAGVAIALTPFARLTGERRRAVAAAADRYARFLDRPTGVR